MPSPSRSRVRRPNSCESYFVDTFGSRNAPPMLNTRCDILNVPGGGAMRVSTVIPPAGYRAAILGVGFETTTALAAPRFMGLAVTRCGDGLGGAEDGLGTYTVVATPVRLANGAVRVSTPNQFPAGVAFYTREGDALTPLWAISNDLAAGEVGNAYVYYWLFPSANVPACP